MNETPLHDMVLDRFHSLPEIFQSIFHSGVLQQTALTLSGTYNLSNAQSQKLANELLFVLFLFEGVPDLERNLSRSLSIPQTLASRLVEKIETGVFSEIIDTLTTVANDPEFVSLRSLQETPSPSVPDVFPSVREKTVPIPQPDIPRADKNFKEKLELRPEQDPESPPSRPLTREEVMKAVATKRTMADDIATINTKKGGGEVRGYAARQDKEGE